jgi:hypothetical protein
MQHYSVVTGCALPDVLSGHSAIAKVQNTHTRQHSSVTSQKTQIFSNTAVRTPNPAVTVLLQLQVQRPPHTFT